MRSACWSVWAAQVARAPADGYKLLMHAVALTTGQRAHLLLLIAAPVTAFAADLPAWTGPFSTDKANAYTVTFDVELVDFE